MSVKANEVVDGRSAAKIIEEGMLLGRTSFRATSNSPATNRGKMSVFGQDGCFIIKQFMTVVLRQPFIRILSTY